jgi:thioredoxin 1
MSHAVTLTAENFEAEVLKSELPVLVDFWAPWCGPCRMMAPIIDELATKHAGKIKIAKLDVNEAEHQALADKYGIQGIPTLKVFKNGEVVKELVGFKPSEALENEIAEFTV